MSTWSKSDIQVEDHSINIDNSMVDNASRLNWNNRYKLNLIQGCCSLVFSTL